MPGKRGFTLIEVLVVLAIIAILSTIGIVAYQTAMTRARQRRTMADMRAIAVAWEARATDYKQYNAAGFTMPAITLTYPEAAALLTPNYIRVLPMRDAWGTPYVFALDQSIGSGIPASDYAIRSAGADGLLDATITAGPFSDASTDIVYSGGSFVTFPQGVQ